MLSECAPEQCDEAHLPFRGYLTLGLTLIACFNNRMARFCVGTALCQTQPASQGFGDAVRQRVRLCSLNNPILSKERTAGRLISLAAQTKEDDIGW